MFSRATITDTLDLFSEIYTHNMINKFAMRYGLDHIAVGNSKAEKVTSIAKHLIENPNSPGILSDNLMYEIVEHIINEAARGSYRYDSEKKEFVNFPQLRLLLLKDGFSIEDGKLVRIFETDIAYHNNETLLKRLLDKHQFEVALGHYNQASNAFNRGDWASCNGQLRSYVEELLQQIAERLTGRSFPTSHEARVSLSQTDPPIFYSDLNEWLGDGKGFFETFWKRLHPHGSHPGLSNEEDSIFRWNLVQISTLEILRRFDKNVSE